MATFVVLNDTEMQAAITAIFTSGVANTIQIKGPLAGGSPVTFKTAWFTSASWSAFAEITSFDHDDRGVLNAGALAVGADPRWSAPGWTKFTWLEIICAHPRTSKIASSGGIYLNGIQRGPIEVSNNLIKGTPFSQIGPGAHSYLLSSNAFTRQHDIVYTDNAFSDGMRGISLVASNHKFVGNAKVVIERNTYTDIMVDEIIQATASGLQLGDDASGNLPAAIPYINKINDNVIANQFNDMELVACESGAYIRRLGGLTGAADGPTFVFCFQIQPAVGAIQQFLLRYGGIIVERLSSTKIHVVALNTVGAIAIEMTSTNNVIQDTRCFGLVKLNGNGTSQLWLYREGDYGVGTSTMEATDTAVSQTLDLTGDCTILGSVQRTHASLFVGWQGIDPDFSDINIRNLFFSMTAGREQGINTTALRGAAKAQFITTYGATAGDPLFWFYGPAVNGASTVATYDGNSIVSNRGRGGVFTFAGVFQYDHGDGVQFVTPGPRYDWEIARNYLFSGRTDALKDTRYETRIKQQIFLNDLGHQSVLISNGTPAVITTLFAGAPAPHLYTADMPFCLLATGLGAALPAGTATRTIYYVLAAGSTTNTFRFSLTPGGAPVNTSSVGVGAFTMEHHNVRFHIHDNAMFSAASSHGITLYAGIGCIVENNGSYADPLWGLPSGYANATGTITSQDYFEAVGKNNILRNNVAGGISSEYVSDVVSNNKASNPGTVTVNSRYVDLFVGDGAGGFSPNNIAEMLACFTAKPGGPLTIENNGVANIGPLFEGGPPTSVVTTLEVASAAVGVAIEVTYTLNRAATQAVTITPSSVGLTGGFGVPAVVIGVGQTIGTIEFTGTAASSGNIGGTDDRSLTGPTLVPFEVLGGAIDFPLTFIAFPKIYVGKPSVLRLEAAAPVDADVTVTLGAVAGVTFGTSTLVIPAGQDYVETTILATTVGHKLITGTDDSGFTGPNQIVISAVKRSMLLAR